MWTNIFAGKRWLTLLFLLIPTLFISGCSDSDSDDSDIPITLTDVIRYRTFAIDDRSIVFIFDIATQKDVLDENGIADNGAIDSVDIRGSFNGWESDNAFVMHASKTDEGIWYLRVATSEVSIPGNSGFPEYKFVVTSGDKTFWLNASQTTPDGYHFGTNHLLIAADDDVEAIMANETKAETIKSLADFDLTTIADQQTIANFRQIPETTQLFRSYHPFKQSRPEQDTEASRIHYVNALMDAHHLQSVITLSGDETGDLSTENGEFISATMQSIIDNNNNLILDTDYNTVYYHSDSAEFGLAVQRIVEFILDDAHPGPYLVHCRLGTDRTGVMSAVLAGLSGASWSEVVADYQQSNEMGNGEFRDGRLLQYSLKNMLGADPADSRVDLPDALTSYMILNGYLTQAQITAFTQKVTAP